MCSILSPQGVVVLLGTFFSICDALTTKHGLERLKTLGDAYIAIGNVTIPNNKHHEVFSIYLLTDSFQESVKFALDVLEAIRYCNSIAENYSDIWPVQLHVRIGCHSGSAVLSEMFAVFNF